MAVVSISLDGIAATWHQSLVQSDLRANTMENWDVYRQLLWERFDDTWADPIAELMRLRKTDGIEEYHKKFDLIRTRVQLS